MDRSKFSSAGSLSITLGVPCKPTSPSCTLLRGGNLLQQLCGSDSEHAKSKALQHSSRYVPEHHSSYSTSFTHWKSSLSAVYDKAEKENPHDIRDGKMQ